ncbi:hypothetical protein KJ673_02525 [Patescibacteria group bacterium]|nr:hypothetical protein [Patescibacteria group bacterium]MBU4453337.1 hypothetical protein [Patescibacteria group bacterium]MCG2687745.1 hypothetical protein [Candidatus Parcubacteria bacterium]
MENREVRRPTNWHLTELESGVWSVGATEDEPGFYPADTEKGDAPATVAPGKYVEDYVKEHGDEMDSHGIREAILAWRREN